MSVLITLQSLPNQSLTSTLDGNRYQMTFKSAGSVMAVDIVRDNITLMHGARLVAGTPLLPYDYQAIGNFIFVTDNDTLPDWQQFSATQSLIYFTQSEIQAIRDGN